MMSLTSAIETLMPDYDTSDEDADRRLCAAFPGFFYGQILNETNLLERPPSPLPTTCRQPTAAPVIPPTLTHVTAPSAVEHFLRSTAPELGGSAKAGTAAHAQSDGRADGAGAAAARVERAAAALLAGEMAGWVPPGACGAGACGAVPIRALCPFVLVAWEDEVAWEGAAAVPQTTHPCVCGRYVHADEAAQALSIVCVHCARPFHGQCLDILPGIEVPTGGFYCRACLPSKPPPVALGAPPSPPPVKRRPLWQTSVATEDKPAKRKPGPKSNVTREKRQQKKDEILRRREEKLRAKEEKAAMTARRLNRPAFRTDKPTATITAADKAAAKAAAKLTGKVGPSAAAVASGGAVAAVEVAARRRDAEDKELTGVLFSNMLLPPDTAWSTHVRSVPAALDAGTWVGEIEWEGAAQAAESSEPLVVLDLNDPHMLFDVTVVKPLRMHGVRKIHQQIYGRHKMKKFEAEKLQREENERARRAAYGHLPLPNRPNDPFRLSNDDKYHNRDGSSDPKESLKKSLTARPVDHTLFAADLHPDCFPANLSVAQLRDFHRPRLNGNHEDTYFTVTSTTEHADDHKAPRPPGPKMRLRDLTAKDSFAVILAEYCEEYPPLMGRPGMCSLMRNFYKQRSLEDRKLPPVAHGIPVFIGPKDTSPFLGEMKSQQLLQALENNLFRAPIYAHDMRQSDFLVIHTAKDNYYIRDVQGLYAVGQLCPKIEVPAPNSKKEQEFVRNRIAVYIERLFHESSIVRVDDIRKAFPAHLEAQARRILATMAQQTRSSDRTYVLKKDYALTLDTELRCKVTPEACCAHESMLANKQRLVDMGYGLEHLSDMASAYAKDQNVFQPDDEAKLAHWRTTADFLAHLRDSAKVLLAITGSAAPSRKDEGFSYLRLTGRTAAVQSKSNSKFMPAKPPPQKATGTLFQTDKDLRRLTMSEMRAKLVNEYGEKADKVKALKRWDLVGQVRLFETKRAVENDVELEFARSKRANIVEHRQRFKEDTQRIFEQQNKSLGNKEDLTTDEQSDDDDIVTGDVDTFEKLDFALAMTTSERQRGALEKRRAKLEDDLRRSVMAKFQQQAGPEAQSAADSAVAAAGPKALPRKLVIVRKAIVGREVMKTTEVVTDDRVIRAYLHHMASNKTKKVIDLKDDTANDRKKRLHELVKKKASGAVRVLSASGGGGGGGAASGSSAGRVRASAPAPSALSQGKFAPALTCSRCHALGHIRTNVRCPLFSQPDDRTTIRPGVARARPRKRAVGGSGGGGGGGGGTFSVDFASDDDDDAEVDLGDDDAAAMYDEAEGPSRRARAAAPAGSSVQVRILEPIDDQDEPSLMLKFKMSSRDKQSDDLYRDDYVSVDGIRKRKREFDLEDDAVYVPAKRSERSRQDPKVILEGVLADVLSKVKSADVGVSSIFMSPVSRKTYPDYYVIVERPLDLATIHGKIKDLVYLSRHDFLADMNQIAINALLYNGSDVVPGAMPIYNWATRLRDTAVKAMRVHEDKLQQAEQALGSYDASFVYKSAVARQTDADAVAAIIARRTLRTHTAPARALSPAAAPERLVLRLPMRAANSAAPDAYNPFADMEGSDAGSGDGSDDDQQRASAAAANVTVDVGHSWLDQPLTDADFNFFS